MKKINTRICVTFITAIILITIAVSTCLTVLFTRILNQKIVDAQEVFLQQNQTNVQNMMNSVNQISVNLTSDTILADLLNKRELSPLERYNNMSKLDEQFARYVNAPLSDELNTYFSTLYLFDRFEISKDLSSTALRLNPQRLHSVYSIRAVAGEQWLKDTIKENGGIHTFVLPDQNDTVFVARLIKNIHINLGTYNEEVGIMVMALSAEQFARQVEASNLTPHSETYIIDAYSKDKSILYGTNLKTVGQGISQNSKLMSAQEFRPGETVVINGEKYFFMKYSTYWDWDILSLIPLSDIYQEMRPVVLTSVVISAIGVLIGVIVITLLSYSITRPLLRLTQIMKNIDRQENITDFPVILSKRQDEVALLYESFGKMMGRIQKLMHEVYDKGVQQKESELLALQAQINPHFIYNALDSINWLSLCNGNDDIVEIVSSLADIVRYSIKNPYEKVTLRDELFHVENYIKIQQKQSQSSIDIKMDIPEPYKSVEMPKFLIEPLVENSILHGLKNFPGEGKILISCAREEDRFVIRVADNGEGADVTVLNRYMAGELEQLAHSDGFGIRNVNERIQLIYGPAYGLSFEQNDSQGLCAKISLPYVNAD